MTRCKFVLTGLEPLNDQDGNVKVRFDARYGDVEEDKQFSKYTPTGHMEATINNKRVLDQLKVGEEYYIDITPCQPKTLPQAEARSA